MATRRRRSPVTRRSQPPLHAPLDTDGRQPLRCGPGQFERQPATRATSRYRPAVLSQDPTDRRGSLAADLIAES